MNGIFVDTGAWYALVDSDDADHKAAAAFLASNTMPLITTNFIFSETVTLIRYRIGHEAARSFGQKLMESSFVRVVAVRPPMKSGHGISSANTGTRISASWTAPALLRWSA